MSCTHIFLLYCHRKHHILMNTILKGTPLQVDAKAFGTEGQPCSDWCEDDELLSSIFDGALAHKAPPSLQKSEGRFMKLLARGVKYLHAEAAQVC
jgi:hypothetical protein